MCVTWTYADKRKGALERFMKSTLPKFIADHEFHLRDNGSNGHYIGNKVRAKKNRQGRWSVACTSIYMST